MVEVARRSLAAALDGAPFTRPGTAGFRISATEQLELAVDLEADAAVLRLDVEATPHRWRSGWMLEVSRGDDRWMLGAETREIEIPKPRGARVMVRPRIAQRALSRELDGKAEHVPLLDVACYRYTRQSTLCPSTPGELAPWAEPTAREAAPWWELDLARAMYVGWLRIDLAAPPAGTRIAIRAYAHVQPDTSPPRASLVFEARADELAAHAGRLAITVDRDVVARYIRIELTAPAGETVELAVIAAEVLAAELVADTLELTLRRSFTLFRDRALFVIRDGTDYRPAATYGEIWRRAMAFSRGLASRIEPIAAGPAATTDRSLAGRGVLALLLRSRPEWLVADLAGLVRGYVSVPISPDEPDDRLAQILSRVSASCLVCEATDAGRLRRIAPEALVIAYDDPGPDGFAAIERAGAERGPHAPDLPPVAPRAADDLYAVLFTSGSTGAPKGAMRTYATFFAMVGSYQVGHSPRHLSFQPLSHLSERMYLPALLIHGGTIAFSRGGAHLLEELRAFEPTTLGSVPRLFEVLHASYRRRLRALIAAEPETSRGALEQRALGEARASFGSKLTAISIGSAPVSAEVFGFLKKCFADIWVSEGYGSTEVGTIATDGTISEQADVKLIPLPDQAPTPGAVERGEIWVRSPHAISGYLGDPEATAAAFDAEGYFATGDLGERVDGKIRVVGRLRNTVKLAQGEFVSAERIEIALAGCPLVDRVFVHAVAGATAVSALVVPHADALARVLDPAGSTPRRLAELCADPAAASHVLAALRAQAASAGLATYEVPRGVLLESAPFTAASGLVTANGKLARGTLAARYGDRLAALDTSGDAAPIDEVEDEDELDLRQRVVRVASRAIGRAIAIDEPLVAAGVDSLASAEILAALSDELGRDVPLAWWFEARTLGDLAIRLAHFAPTAAPPTLRATATADLALPPIGRSASVSTRPLRHVLLTGATGFLGAHLVEALVARGLEVTCLVRAADDHTARARLAAALASRAIPPHEGARAIAGDLAAPGLGLDEGARSALGAIDAVIHAAATVSWLASYAALREPNVLGTRTVLELAAEHGWAVHHVSTISTVPADGDEASSLTLDVALSGTPYGLSKWIAERHVLQTTGLPIAVYRPAMIAAHSERGVGNPDDFVCRYLAGCSELGLYVDRDDAILDMTPVDFVARAIVALAIGRPADGSCYHLTNVEQSLSFAAIGRALARDRPIRPATYEDFRAALAHSKGRLHALAAFFPERFDLGMGPWPCSRTLSALAALGVAPPPIDDAMIARDAAWLANR